MTLKKNPMDSFLMSSRGAKRRGDLISLFGNSNRKFSYKFNIFKAVV